MMESEEQRRRKIVIAVFSHIEAYPPSLNAVHHLAEQFDEVHILHRNVMKSEWNYPSNVVVIPFGEYVEAEKVKYLPLYKKVGDFLKFGIALKALIGKQKPSVILVYDAPAFALLNLFSWSKIKQLSARIWYHNHDVMPENELPKYSIMWMTRKLELRYFKRINYFSLPNSARLSYFPFKQLGIDPIIIPNYPSKNFFGKFTADHKNQEVIRIIFQGQISPSNKLDIFIDLLTHSIRGKTIELHLAGPVDEGYQKQLIDRARILNVEGRLFMYGRLPYSKLPALTASCHIGLAVYGEHNTMVRTMSTASNKIFEYASVGLPVLINKREDMEKEFIDFPWIHFAVIQKQELLDSLDKIISSYAQYALLAKRDFEEKVNFEKFFLPVLQIIKN